jgi:phosphohistidine swiveling domain-containing protein
VVGGKAHGMGLALRRGLPVPPGFVLVGDAEDPGPARLATLPGTRFAVRSSATFEDRPGAGAAGLLLTRLEVPAGEIASAARACRASARTPQVEAYLLHRGLPGPFRVSVIVQAQVGPGRRGTLASVDPCGSGLARIEEDVPGGPRVTLCAREALDEPLRSALGLEADLGGPIEVEWAEESGRIFVLQARPAAAAPRPPADPFPIEFTSSAERERLWRWDREHNPAPLTPAQEGLVALVAGAADAVQPLRVWHGYLFAGESPGPQAPADEDPARAWRERVVPAMEADLAPLEAERDGASRERPHRQLERALDFFASFYARYAAWMVTNPAGVEGDRAPEVPPAVARDQDLWRLGRAAARVPGLLGYLGDPSRPAPPSAEMVEWFTTLRTHLDRWGAFAPVWDVAAPTYGEDPRPLYAVMLELARDARSPFERRHAAAGTPGPGAVREADDLYFARALRVVRRALLAVGRAWVDSGRLDEPGDVFLLPLDAVRDKAPPDARAQAAAARTLHAARARLVPPLALRGHERHWPRPAGDLLFGHGVGGRVRGPAAVIRDATHPVVPVPGTILVVPTVLPGMTFLLATAAGVVTDHGGLLDHGAYMAREYGLPAVVGTIWGTRVLRDGDDVVVDGAAGRVFRMKLDL